MVFIGIVGFLREMIVQHCVFMVCIHCVGKRWLHSNSNVTLLLDKNIGAADEVAVELARASWVKVHVQTALFASGIS